jgi:Outer membrane protein beta-barrel domain
VPARCQRLSHDDRLCYQRGVTTHPRQRTLAWLLWVCCGSLPLMASSVARAYEDQLSLGVGLGYAHATERGRAHSGALFGVEAGIGLSDTFTVRSSLSYSVHPDARALSVLGLGAELLYLVDVLEVVPYFGAGLDLLGSWTAGHGALRGDLGLHPVLGLDWLINRDVALGIEARPVFLLTALQRAPVYVTAGVTASLLFDL